MRLLPEILSLSLRGENCLHVCLFVCLFFRYQYHIPEYNSDVRVHEQV